VRETVVQPSIGNIVREVDGTVFGEVMERREVEASELPALH
jgi:hypothetical protein